MLTLLAYQLGNLILLATFLLAELYNINVTDRHILDSSWGYLHGCSDCHILHYCSLPAYEKENQLQEEYESSLRHLRFLSDTTCIFTYALLQYRADSCLISVRVLASLVVHKKETAWISRTDNHHFYDDLPRNVWTQRRGSYQYQHGSCDYCT